jgi:hypothetical protein
MISCPIQMKKMIVSHRYPSPTLAVIFLLFISPSYSRSQNWVLTSAPNTNWSCIASSADGSRLVAAINGGLIYASTNAGVTWSPTSAPATNWASVACSADGTKLVASAGLKVPPVLNDTNHGLIYSSADSGRTWAPTSAPDETWRWVASSADGTRLAAVPSSAAIYTSSNSGATWASNTLPNPAACVVSSANGLKLVAGTYEIYASTNSGASWTQIGTPPVFYGFLRSIASSADGNCLAAAEGAPSFNHCLEPVPICTSADSGSSWTNTGTYTPYCTGWASIASSADGAKLAAVEGCCGHFLTSNDRGVTWSSDSVLPCSGWNSASLASSADGAKFVAAVNSCGGAASGSIYTRQGTSAPVLNISGAEGGVLISWLIPSSRFVLQENSNLTSTAWRDVATAPTFDPSTLQYQVSIPKPLSTLFYRLALLPN